MSSPNSNNNMNFDLAVGVFAVFIVIVLWRLLYFWKHRNDPIPRNPPARQVEDHQDAKSQEVIEKLLVLKTAIRIDPDSNAGAGAFGVKRLKSNIRLFDGDDNGQRTCAICLGDYEDGDQICWSNNQDCTHHFHSTCGVAWLARHSQCPICRADYLVEPEILQEASEEKGAVIDLPIHLDLGNLDEELQNRADDTPNDEASPDENV